MHPHGRQKVVNMRIVLLGHVNSGKSTTIGHLMCNIDQIVTMRDKEKAQQLGYSWILEEFKSLKEKNEYVEEKQLIDTTRFLYKVVEIPGHKDFIKHMITGTSIAECAMLFVSAVPEEFATEISESGHIIPHLYLAWALGISQLLVVVNKMDAVNFSEIRFIEIMTRISSIIDKIGYKNTKIPFIPVSGLHGDNLTQKSNNLSGWWPGPTLSEAIKSFKPPKSLADKPLRVPVQDVYKIGGIGTVPVGRVESGILKSGVQVIFVPGGVVTEVRSVELHNDEMEAYPGDVPGFNVKNVSVKLLRRGMVCGDPKNNPPRVALYFRAKVVVLRHEGKLTSGYTASLDCHCVHLQCRLTRIHCKLNRRNGATVKNAPPYLLAGDCADVTIVPSKPLCVECFRDFSALGRFAFRHQQNKLIGIITHIGTKEPMWASVRWLWIAKLKENPSWCPIARLPPEIVRVIAEFVAKPV